MTAAFDISFSRTAACDGGQWVRYIKQVATKNLKKFDVELKCHHPSLLAIDVEEAYQIFGLNE